ncbi:MAG: hypothetical protein ABFD91_11275 [Anaerohalosphaeraceae bacterium]
MKKLALVLCCISVLGLVGCACLTGQKEAPAPAKVEPKPAPAPAPAPTPAPAPVATSKCGANQVSCTYPSSGVLKIDKMMPASVAVGQPFDYTILVTNLTDMELNQVVVNDRLPANYAYKSATPGAEPSNGMLTWKMATLGPKAQEKIVVTGSAKEIGCLKTCADATFIIPACAVTEVVQPALALSKTCPAEVLLCDQIALKYMVSNKGTGVAKDVVITDQLPEGLTLTTGQKVVEIKVGNLEPGKSMVYTVMAKAAKTGTYKSGALANAAGNLKAESEACATAVKQPVLAITKTGPEKQYLGRKISYEITVANKGDAPATAATLTDTIPAGVGEVTASDGGQVAGSQVTWNLGTLAVGQSRKVTVSYLPQSAGSFSNVASVAATCAESVKASAKTDVAGIAAILLEVIDVSDPIEVGKNETYIITVTNQGSAPDTDIIVKCKLEDSMQFVNAGGATTGSFADGVVTFQALGSLAPKAKASWKVEVKSVKAGDVRFTTTLTSKQLGREVMETEATNFYE